MKAKHEIFLKRPCRARAERAVSSASLTVPDPSARCLPPRCWNGISVLGGLSSHAALQSGPGKAVLSRAKSHPIWRPTPHPLGWPGLGQHSRITAGGEETAPEPMASRTGEDGLRHCHFLTCTISTERS